MFARPGLRVRLETAIALDEYLTRDLVEMIDGPCSDAQAALPKPPDYDGVFAWAERIHPGFLYLAWRSVEGRHYCSMAMEEQDLDQHSWLGRGATPSLALAAALVSSLEKRGEPLPEA